MATQGRTTVVMSIAPKWVAMILDGKKQVELRRRVPSAGFDGCDVLIYATSPVSSIVAKCEANGFVRGSAETLWRQIGKVSGCTKNEFFDYFADAKHPSAIWLRNVFPIQPLTLEALRKDLGWHPPVAWCYLDSGSPILSWIRER